MKNWITNNWMVLVGAVTSLGLGFWINPKRWFNRKEDEEDSAAITSKSGKYKLIRDEFRSLHDEVMELQKEVRALRDEIHLNKVENIDLRNENRLLKVDLALSQTTSLRLQKELDELLDV